MKDPGAVPLVSAMDSGLSTPGFSFQSYWFDFLGEIENFGQNIDIQIAHNNVSPENSLNLSCGLKINNAHSFQFVNDADAPSIRTDLSPQLETRTKQMLKQHT